MQKCKYPDCTLCVDNCIVKSIDFSKSPPDFKQNCLNCHLCNRMCPVGAIELDAQTRQRQAQKTINMKKCTYPKCNICVKHCPMNSIDFSMTPPGFNWSCEQCNLCWAICPQGAIEVETTSPFGMHHTNEEHPYFKFLQEAAAKGSFRWAVSPDDIGWDNIIGNIKRLPRFSIEELNKD